MAVYPNEIVRIANATARSSGAVGRNPLVYRYATEVLSKSDSILDFGAGPLAIHTQRLRGLGFQDVVAWDFGKNFLAGLHAEDALSRVYHAILVSNVFNVLSQDAVRLAVGEIVKCIKEGGRVIWNFPDSPHKYLDVDKHFVQSEFVTHGLNVHNLVPHVFLSEVSEAQNAQ